MINPQGTGVLGYRIGSAYEIAAKALLAGGISRPEITKQLKRDYPNVRSWEVTMTNVTKELEARGYRLITDYRWTNAKFKGGVVGTIENLRMQILLSDLNEQALAVLKLIEKAQEVTYRHPPISAEEQDEETDDEVMELEPEPLRRPSKKRVAHHPPKKPAPGKLTRRVPQAK